MRYIPVRSPRYCIQLFSNRCHRFRETIDVFAKNCITLKMASDDKTPIVLMANVPLTADMKKGEMGDDEDSMSEYFYLENEDGTTVSKEVISRMNEKAQAIWEALDERGLAPTTFDNISEIAWDFYARIMLNDPEFFFLQLCDDGQWKLKEWSNSAYSSWYDNRQKKAKSNNSTLDDTNPIQLSSTQKTNNKIDCDPGSENGSEVNCRGNGYEEHNTETPHPTSDSRKRKTEGKVASGSLKKQKEVETLAIPTDRNTIRNICMRHWNKLQPGGQGLASEFDAYFKTLSDTDKEPFKKEMRAVPRATKKARTAGK
ncbi:hypothetical protein H4582DRAFT_908008 [Lactarius indigo]|nr:hypothetical protein H4582DRAFT_908008 [Lactarius indigo]